MPRGVTRAAYPRVASAINGVKTGTGVPCPTTPCVAEGAHSLSRNCSASRAGSPLLFGLAPRGVFPCSRNYYRDGGLLPHLFTLTKRISVAKTSHRFPCAMPPCCAAGGIFSVALSVTEPHRVELNSTPPVQVFSSVRNSTLQRSLRGRPLALPGALP